MTNWQYLRVTTNELFDVDTLNAKYGYHGWELIQIIHPDLDGDKAYDYYFKRPAVG